MGAFYKLAFIISFDGFPLKKWFIVICGFLVIISIALIIRSLRVIT